MTRTLNFQSIYDAAELSALIGWELIEIFELDTHDLRTLVFVNKHGVKRQLCIDTSGENDVLSLSEPYAE